MNDLGGQEFFIIPCAQFERLLAEIRDIKEQLAQLNDELDHTQGEIWSAHSNGRPHD